MVVPLTLPLGLTNTSASLTTVTTLTIPGGASSTEGDYLFDTQFRFWIPDEATTLLVEVESVSANGEGADLYLRSGSPVTEDEQYVYFSSSSIGGDLVKRIELSESSEPSVCPGPLFLALGTYSNTEVRVAIRVSCTVSELPEGADDETAGLLQIPFLLVNVADVLSMSVPVGWIPLAEESLAVSTLAAFEMPQAEGQPTTGYLEVSTWPLTEVSEVDELQRRLEVIYADRGNQTITAREVITIDGHDARKSILVDHERESGTLFACFIDDGAAWLLTTTFAPLGYADLYMQVFDVGVASLRLIKQGVTPDTEETEVPEQEDSVGRYQPQDMMVQAPVGDEAITGAWEVAVIGKYGPLSDVHGNSSEDVVAVSLFGAVLQYESGQWTCLRGASGPPLTAARIVQDLDILVAGLGGDVLTYSPLGWTDVPIPTSHDLYDLSALPSGVLLAVGQANLLLVHDGNQWGIVPIVLPGEEQLRVTAVWGLSLDDLYLVGWDLDSQEGRVVHYDGAVWCLQDLPQTRELYDIWGTSDGELYVVGAPTGSEIGYLGTILHYDGMRWKEMATPVHAHVHLEGIWGVSDEEIYAVGSHGALLVFDGANWSWSMIGVEDLSFSAVWGSSSTGVFVVGSRGLDSVILHRS